MKKGIVFALAIALMVLFVGCGLQNQLAGTKWEMKYVEDDDSETVTFDLKESGPLLVTTTVVYNGESDSYTEEGKWFCADDILFLEGDDLTYEGCYEVEINKDEMILTVEDSGFFIKLTKVN